MNKVEIPLLSVRIQACEGITKNKWADAMQCDPWTDHGVFPEEGLARMRFG